MKENKLSQETIQSMLTWFNIMSIIMIPIYATVLIVAAAKYKDIRTYFFRAIAVGCMVGVVVALTLWSGI